MDEAEREKVMGLLDKVACAARAERHAAIFADAHAKESFDALLRGFGLNDEEMARIWVGPETDDGAPEDSVMVIDLEEGHRLVVCDRDHSEEEDREDYLWRRYDKMKKKAERQTQLLAGVHILMNTIGKRNVVMNVQLRATGIWVRWKATRGKMKPNEITLTLGKDPVPEAFALLLKTIEESTGT